MTLVQYLVVLSVLLDVELRLVSGNWIGWNHFLPFLLDRACILVSRCLVLAEIVDSAARFGLVPVIVLDEDLA